MEKPEIREAIVVEGRYDKNTLSQVIRALIVQTNGFQIYKNEELRRYLRSLAQERGLVILTDSDSAGFMIRKSIRSCIPGEFLKDAYIPDIYGKERRKVTPGKEGKLGVEGMRPEVLLTALRAAGATFLNNASTPAGEAAEQANPNLDTIRREKLTTADLFAAGFTGTPGSQARKAALLKEFDLPEHLSTRDLPEALSTKISREEFLARYTNKED